VNWKELPAPFATPSARNNSTIVPKPADAKLQAPAGFVVEGFMDFADLRPRFMVLGPSNEILISDTSRNGSVSFSRATGTITCAGTRLRPLFVPA
jgi:hypothetical protein